MRSKISEIIGAKTIDLEWVQVHPTGLVNPDDPDAELHGDAPRSTCLRVVDSGEDSELHEAIGVSSTDPLTENA